MYKLIGTAGTRAFRVLWMLEELGVDYDHLGAAPRSPDVTAVSPLGKVPVLMVDDVAIPDSTAILTFLADKHGALTFPAGSLERARQDAMTFRALDELDAVLWVAARHSFILPEEHRVPEVKNSLKHEFQHNLARIAAEIEGPFVMGETMTIADIVLCHCGSWARAAQFPDAPPAFVEYMRGLRGREAFKRASAKRA
ncbi:glutathione S-transferase family protein [Mesobacterium sp. TK19101]|uniref:Glutathione S-transferase family protein n=1 Tax=Mesobacterium hydrothermale TaxID=3111907 RepID=A0ABU6HBR7_9RHOB|nr:glutathione S-transferase family protein [Mesobacterium sp. TK19101]MEC3859904.1 glutathione S-transferase family protein [Mesobacterium sp. TK19101]